MVHLRRRLKAHYRMRRMPRGKHSIINRLKYNQLNAGGVCPRLKAKAAQTRRLMPFIRILADENWRFLGAGHRHLRRVVSALVDMEVAMKRSPRIMPPVALSQLQNHIVTALREWKAWGGHETYKFHVAWDLAKRASTQGNPLFYWTYADEQENRVMGTAAKSVHAGPTFYVTLLQKILPEAR